MSKKRPIRKPLTDAQFSRMLAMMAKNLALVQKSLAEQDKELDALEKGIDDLQHWTDHAEDEPPDFDYKSPEPKKPVKPSRARRTPCRQETV